MNKPPLFLLLLVLYVAFSVPAWAEKADRMKPMQFEANTMRVDDVKQVTVFDGNVLMTKGSIIVRAARVDVRQTPDGYQSAVITGAPDRPAFFRQKREAVDEFIEVESERIDYDGSADIVKFTGKAQLRRLRGAELADEISGAVIVYENLTDKFSVDGSSSTSSPGVTPAPGGRVRAMLTPKPETAAPSTPAPKTPAQPSPTLRPSPSLGSVPQ
jgi:lipopolysaccharide export system protein LptA